MTATIQPQPEPMDNPLVGRRRLHPLCGCDGFAGSRPAPKPKRPVGRPRKPHLEHAFEPTKEHRELVKLLAGYGIPEARTAARRSTTRSALSTPTSMCSQSKESKRSNPSRSA
jgi:hypothetical protein